ncbi:hypothetical protein JCM11641_002417 [Rhodosporidiobolus odoratus]
MIDTPVSLHLPSGSTLIEDVDEEIFLLYTRKQQLAGPPTVGSSGFPSSSGLGSHSDKEGVLFLSLAVSNPLSTVRDTSTAQGKKSKKAGRKGTEKEEEVTVEVELHQELNALRNRKGDTGSVLWRLSMHLALYLLRSYHFPHPSYRPLFPSLFSSRILELGSGTGFLGLALRSLFNSPAADPDATRGASWIFTDQLVNLPLVVRNLRANGVDPASPSARVAVEELDWLAESQEWEKRPGSLYAFSGGGEETKIAKAPDLILAADCIYNPSLSIPLARTILRQAGRATIVLVASELRDEEPLEVFLRAWVEEGREEGWTLARVGWVEGEEEEKAAGELASGQFVLWVGWREQTKLNS